MSDLNAPSSERDDIEMLLPWLVTGRLDANDQARVETYLSAHPEMRRQLELIEAERTGATMNNEAAGTPSADTLARLLLTIESRSLARRSGLAKVGSAMQDALDWLSRRSALVPLAAAAAVVLLLQAGTIGALLWQGPPTSGLEKRAFQTASAPKPAAELPAGATFILAGFAPTATAREIDQTLQSLGITIADGPRSGGIYRLKLSDKPLGDSERDLLLTALRSNAGVIRFVAQAGQ